MCLSFFSFLQDLFPQGREDEAHHGAVFRLHKHTGQDEGRASVFFPQYTMPPPPRQTGSQRAEQLLVKMVERFVDREHVVDAVHQVILHDQVCADAVRKGVARAAQQVVGLLRAQPQSDRQRKRRLLAGPVRPRGVLR